MRNKKIVLSAVFAVIAAGVLLFGVSAQGANQHLTTLTCGATLTQSLTLSANLDCSGYAGTALTAGANGITVNLNGHSITANGSNECFYSDDYNGVLIKNGTLNGCTYGVDIEYAIGGGASNLTINAPTSYAFYGEYDAGINVSGITSAPGASAYGIYLEYGTKNAVTSPKITGTFEYGVYLYEEGWDTVSGGAISDTSSSYYNYYDEDGGNNLWTGNTSTGNYNGFYLECDDNGPVTVTGNSVTGASSDGFNMSECYYDEGYPPTTFTKFTNNVATNNGGYGVDTYENYNDTISGNKANGNSSGGFYLEEETGVSFTGNTASQNYSDGFYFEDLYSYYVPATIAGNTAKNNQGWGYDSNYGVAGSSNTSTGNTSGACYIVSGCIG